MISTTGSIQGQRREIDQIGQKFHSNLCAAASLEEVTTSPRFVSLTAFIEHFNWQYADLDIIDRLEMKYLAAEDFAAISVNLRCRCKSLATFRRRQWPKA